MPAASDETLDRLAGTWWIVQLRRGHRYNTDDVLTAWTGLQARSDALRVLDLGSGIGALGLLALVRLPGVARLVGLEVQPESIALARRSVELNGLTARVEFRLGDLRDPAALASEAPFDLILANPPYLPAGSATASPYPQRRAARLELHGDVFDTCRAAAAHLAEDGSFCFCHAAADPRPERAVVAAGLSLTARREVIFRHGRPAHLALFTCRRRGERQDPPSLAVRGCDGRWTEAMRALRREMWIEA